MDDQRIAGADVTSRLATHGAVLIEGAKAVGTTTTALTLCTSHVRLDRDAATRAAASVDPRLVLDGSPPRRRHPSARRRKDYVRALERLFPVEDQRAWSPRLRSHVRLSATPKRHLTDPSLAVAALGASVERRDGRWLGVEVKLGLSQVAAAAANLLTMHGKLGAEVRAACGALLVVVADTPTYVRTDGVVVTSLASLGP